MPRIELITHIQAPTARVFDLSRSIDLHMDSTADSEEKAVAGVTSGLIGPGEEVTWQARHFGIRQRLTSRIMAFDRPNHFRDSMVRGAFRRFDHDHYFTAEHSHITRMMDVFDFHSPGWVFGILADRLFLSRYLEKFLMERNRVIKEAAESEQWRKYLPSKP